MLSKKRSRKLRLKANNSSAQLQLYKNWVSKPRLLLRWMGRDRHLKEEEKWLSWRAHCHFLSSLRLQRELRQTTWAQLTSRQIHAGERFLRVRSRLLGTRHLCRISAPAWQKPFYWRLSHSQPFSNYSCTSQSSLGWFYLRLFLYMLTTLS